MDWTRIEMLEEVQKNVLFYLLLQLVLEMIEK